MTIGTKYRPKNWRDKDNLDLATSIERKAWLLWKRIRYTFRGRPKKKQCILIPGMQRSGSKLLVNVLEWSASTDCYPEDDRRAFDYFQMRNVDKILELIMESKAEHFVIKALCESDHIEILLEKFAPAQAIWIFRDFQDCVNSCIRNFGGFAERAHRIAADRRLAGWRGRGMSDVTWETIRRCDRPDMNEATGAALQWYYRNILYFEQGLENDPRVMLVRYEDMVTSPLEVVSEIYSFSGIADMSPWVVRKIHPNSVKKNAVPPISRDVYDLCTDLQHRLLSVEPTGKAQDAVPIYGCRF